MSIAQLPPDTIRAVRSNSVLSDPCALAKELIDNSLDAGATCISVEVAANTLDTIQVKDNGTGIHPNDRPLVCKRSCTSKLRSIDDLENIGGSTLGFRGEALASAAEMCGNIAITTRVSGELVGETLKYDRTGLLISCTKASHPTGTIVRVYEFLRFVPVRKQRALKSTSKTLNRMKKVLNAYVLSRPEIRLSFKILKSKNDSSWIYASNKHPTVSTAMLRVIGAEAISQCTTITWPQIQDERDDSLSGSVERNESIHPVIRLVATIPKPCSDFSAINYAGQYVSIDRRPMSTSNGVAKELVELLKSHIRSGSLCDSGQTPPVDPFCFIHLHCRPGIYDVNVEPLKNDVLFEDSKLVMSIAGNLFKAVYGEIKPRHTHQRNCQIENQPSSSRVIRPLDKRSANNQRDHEVEESPLFRHISSSATKDCHFIERICASPSEAKKDNMSAGSFVDTSACPRAAENNLSLLNSPLLTNPWMLVGGQRVTPKKEGAQSRDLNSQLLTPAYEDERSRLDEKRIKNCEANSVLAGPPYPIPLSTRTLKTRLVEGDYDKSSTDVRKPQMSELCNVPQLTASHKSKQRKSPGVLGSLDAWIRNCRDAPSPSTDESQAVGILQQSEPDGNELTETDIAGRFRKEDNAVATSRSHGDFSAGLSPRTSLNALGIHLNSAHTNAKSHGQPLAISQEEDDYRIPGSTDNRPTSPSHEMVAEALDFEYRKKAAIQLHRKRQQQQQQQQQQVSTQSALHSWAGANNAKISQGSPHQNRYRRAKAHLVNQLPELEFPRHEKTFSPSEMGSEDAREYLMRQNWPPQIGFKSKRILTNQLPLEVIPSASALHGLALSWTKQDDEASIPNKELLKIDGYVTSGIVPPPSAFFEVSPADINIWTTRLLALIQEQYRSEILDEDWRIQLVFDAIPTSHARAS
ncbi:DNA mismatch repair protein mutL [Histoplasma capsulatum var. duboisii H88]|uniref:DNA mismatch repair protein mutL n=1 Tax=Ajellomyces capsulatus (strain H88) TaxID=544711 RepID=A0A8A1LDI5_AJEC8|nr:DNA mismatch repair protein mutL [Histoplasma capsulatum var. duboisii H88]